MLRWIEHRYEDLADIWWTVLRPIGPVIGIGIAVVLLTDIVFSAFT